MLAVTTWPDVGLALVVGVPGIIAAFYANRSAAHARQVVEEIKTPSKTSIGRQIEDVNHTARANNYHLQAMGSDIGTTTPPEATAEVAKVDGLNGVTLVDPEPKLG